MPTRAQHARDAALRRLARVNRSLTAAAIVGTAVLVEVIAQTPLSHAAKRSTPGVAAPTSVSVRPATGVRHPVSHRSRASPSPSPAVSSSPSPAANPSPPPAVSSNPPPAVNPSPPVVVVSGGS